MVEPVALGLRSINLYSTTTTKKNVYMNWFIKRVVNEINSFGSQVLHASSIDIFEINIVMDSKVR